MEQFLRVRLELRKEKLEENITRAEELLLVHKNEKEVLEHDLMRVHATLKQALHGIQTDAEKYISTNSQNTDVLRSALERELKAEELLVELDLVIKKVDTQENTTQATVRLPKLEMPKFDGDVLKWTGFWDRFVARIDSQKLKDSEKLSYLLSLLDKEAKAAVQGLSITDANYQVAVEMLKKRFDDQQQVIFSHYEALDKLNRCEYTSEECRKNLNMIEIRLRVLASLALTPMQYAARFVTLKKSKQLLYLTVLRKFRPEGYRMPIQDIGEGLILMMGGILTPTQVDHFRGVMEWEGYEEEENIPDEIKLKLDTGYRKRERRGSKDSEESDVNTVKYRTWCGLCAICERMYGRFPARDKDPPDGIELSDFTMIETKLAMLKVHPGLIEVLNTIRVR